MGDNLFEKKQGQRKASLRALYGLVEGREGFTITVSSACAMLFPREPAGIEMTGER